MLAIPTTLSSVRECTQKILFQEKAKTRTSVGKKLTDKRTCFSRSHQAMAFYLFYPSHYFCYYVFFLRSLCFFLFHHQGQGRLYRERLLGSNEDHMLSIDDDDDDDDDVVAQQLSNVKQIYRTNSCRHHPLQMMIQTNSQHIIAKPIDNIHRYLLQFLILFVFRHPRHNKNPILITWIRRRWMNTTLYQPWTISIWGVVIV
jgi:hypothetical protein